MKKIVLTGAVIFCLVSCSNSGSKENGADGRRLELDSTLDKIGDSAKAKGERTLEAIKEKVNEIKISGDTISSDTTR